MDSNLLKKTEMAELDTSIAKISIIAVLSFILAIVSSYFLSAALKQPSTETIILAAIPTILFIVSFFLQSLFIKGLRLNSLITLGEAAGLSLFLVLQSPTITVFAAVIIAYLSLISALRRSKTETKNQIKLSVAKIARVSVPKIIAAVALLVAIVYSQPFYPDGLTISKNLIRSIVKPAESAILFASNYFNLGIKSFSIDMTIPQIAQANNFNQALLELQLKNIGLKLSPNETLLDVIQNYINTKAQSLNKLVKWLIFAAIILIAYLTIRSLFWLFSWLIYLFIILFYEILIALGFLEIGYQQINKEVIVL